MKISLLEVRKMGIFKEIETPKVVYHMTDRRNQESIIRSKRIKSDKDYMTYFFLRLEDIPLYIQLTGADHGRQYYDFDGKIHTDPPLIHSDTIVFKLTPRGDQSMEWYTETIAEKRKITDKSRLKLVKYMDEARICHYGSMLFNSDYEIIELTEIDKMPESERLLEVKQLQAKNNK